MRAVYSHKNTNIGFVQFWIIDELKCVSRKILIHTFVAVKNKPNSNFKQKNYRL